MAFAYKIDVLASLKAKGYSTARIRKDKIMGEAMLQKIRQGEMPSWAILDTICFLLECDIGDVITHIPDDEIK